MYSSGCEVQAYAIRASSPGDFAIGAWFKFHSAEALVHILYFKKGWCLLFYKADTESEWQ